MTCPAFDVVRRVREAAGDVFVELAQTCATGSPLILVPIRQAESRACGKALAPLWSAIVYDDVSGSRHRPACSVDWTGRPHQLRGYVSADEAVESCVAWLRGELPLFPSEADHAEDPRRPAPAGAARREV